MGKQRTRQGIQMSSHQAITIAALVLDAELAHARFTNQRSWAKECEQTARILRQLRNSQCDS